MSNLRILSAAAAVLVFAAVPSFAQDAMAPAPMASDAMAPAAMAPMSDADLKTCMEQAGMITFPQVMKAASDACHDMHNGAMGGDAMAPATGAMAPATDAMAPATDAMAPAAMAPAQ